MTWTQAFGLLRLLSEQQVGAPARKAEAEREAQEIERMRGSLEDVH